MVDELLDNPGAAQESVIFAFTADITADQNAEIDRMAAMLAGLSTDPRVGLKAGYLDAALSEPELTSAAEPGGWPRRRPNYRGRRAFESGSGPVHPGRRIHPPWFQPAP